MTPVNSEVHSGPKEQVGPVTALLSAAVVQTPKCHHYKEV